MKNFKILLALPFFLGVLSCSSTQEQGASLNAPREMAAAPPVALSGAYSDKHIDFAAWNRDPETCCEAKGKRIAIASGGPLSSKAGIAVAKMGGNIVDIGVAVAMSQNVERTTGTSLGGGGFLLLHLAQGKKKDFFVDFRETAPQKSSAKDYLDSAGNAVPRATLDGAKAIAVPGMVAGLYDIHKKWGKLPWAQVVQPAIEIAKQGFEISPAFANRIQVRSELLKKDPYTRKLFFNEDGEPLPIGTRLVQADLAKSLELIAAQGKKVFYHGELGKKLVEYLRARGSMIELSDLKNYQVKFREPLTGTFKGYTVLTAPRPSAGGAVLIQGLTVLDGDNLAEMAKDGVGYSHLLVETWKRAYADRSDVIGDPDFSSTEASKNFSKMLSVPYAKGIRSGISMEKAAPSKDIRPLSLIKDNHGTTHVSILDREGNAFSMTISLNTGNFGSAVVVPGTGIVMNNTMDDFNLFPGRANNYGLVSSDINTIRPGRRPVSSMAPTIVLKKGRPMFAIGAAGGSKIPTGIMAVLLNDLFVYPGDLRKSVFAPRVHHQWLPERIEADKPMDTAITEGLRARGHELAEVSFSADVEAVQYSPDTKMFTAVFDPRNQGGAAAQ